MKLRSLSFALALAFSRHASAAYDDSFAGDAVQASLKARLPRPERDSIQRYFLPGSSQLLGLPKLKSLLGGAFIQNVKEQIYSYETPQQHEKALAAIQRLRGADDREGAFLELDLRSDWQREQLAGHVKRRVDLLAGGAIKQSQVDYDSSGRRLDEKNFDRAGNTTFERRYTYDGPGVTPKMIEVLNGDAAMTSKISWILDGKGLPYEEDHTNFQGLPIQHRSYRYDPSGRLISLKETRGAKIRGLRFEWDYDPNGRLIERRVFSWDPLEPTWITQFDHDAATGLVTERREFFDRLPLSGRNVTGSGFDPRKELKYRWRFQDEGASLSYKPWDGAGNEAFFAESRRFSLNPGGWLEELQYLDQDSMPQAREFWDWDDHNNLTRYETWGQAGTEPRQTLYEYRYDAQGNWIWLRVSNEIEPRERTFEYFEP